MADNYHTWLCSYNLCVKIGLLFIECLFGSLSYIVTGPSEFIKTSNPFLQPKKLSSGVILVRILPNVEFSGAFKNICPIASVSVPVITLKCNRIYLRISSILTLISMGYESQKNAHLQSNLGSFFIRLNELGRVSNNPIDANFHLQKSLGIFDKNSADKI